MRSLVSTGDAEALLELARVGGGGTITSGFLVTGSSSNSVNNQSPRVPSCRWAPRPLARSISDLISPNALQRLDLPGIPHTISWQLRMPIESLGPMRSL